MIRFRVVRSGLVLGAGVVFLAAGALLAQGSSRRSPVVEVVEHVSPAVVNISTDRIVVSPFYRGPRTRLEEFFGRYRETPRLQEREVPNSIGSGVIVDPRGYVLTNAHVLARAARVRITTSDGQEYEAEIRGTDPSSDLAVLRILEEEGPFPAVELGSSDDLMIGETVVAIGNPFGYSNTVTTGVVSSLHRSIESGEMVYSDFIQTDAAINPGNSGGPLLNIDGELVGINTAIAPRAEGIGFAIPVDRARRALEELIAYGEVRPTWTGLEIMTLSQRLARHLGIEVTKGALVRGVHRDSPGSRAGVDPGDLILRVGRTPVETRQDFLTALGTYGPGDRAPLWVLREGKELGLTVNIEPLEENRVLEIFSTRYGLEVSAPTRTERSRGLPPDVLVVRQVVPEGPADRTGLVQGDLIALLNGERIESMEELADEFSRTWDRDSVLLGVVRRGILYPVTLSAR